MRILTMIIGTLFMATGIYLVANGGFSFTAVAFIVGLIFVVAGAVECLSYGAHRAAREDKGWILSDGATTFVLGALILMNKLEVEIVVPFVLGLWIMITGIRNLVHAWEKIDDRSDGFYGYLIIGLLNTFLGIYAFFNQDMFAMTTLTLVGIYMVAGGLNIAHIGYTIRIAKPNFLMTKEEKVEDAAAKAEEAHQAAKEAIRVAKEAKAELKVVSATPAEELDAALAPKPGTESGQQKGN